MFEQVWLEFSKTFEDRSYPFFTLIGLGAGLTLIAFVKPRGRHTYLFGFLLVAMGLFADVFASAKASEFQTTNQCLNLLLDCIYHLNPLFGFLVFYLNRASTKIVSLLGSTVFLLVFAGLLLQDFADLRYAAANSNSHVVESIPYASGELRIVELEDYKKVLYHHKFGDWFERNEFVEQIRCQSCKVHVYGLPDGHLRVLFERNDGTGRLYTMQHKNFNFDIANEAELNPEILKLVEARPDLAIDSIPNDDILSRTRLPDHPKPRLH